MIPEQIELTITESDEWVLNARFQFREGELPASSKIIIDLTDSPFRLSGENGSAKVSSPAGGAEVSLHVSGDTSGQTGIDIQLVHDSSWSPGSGQTSFWPQSCLVLPDMLPRIVSPESRLDAVPTDLPRLGFRDELPETLDAGGVAGGVETETLLHSVVFKRVVDGPEYDDLVVAPDPNSADEVDVVGVYEYLRPLADYLREEFESTHSVRPVAFITASTDGVTAVGAFQPFRSDEVGGAGSSSGKPVHAIRLLAQAWLSGGVRIWGNNANALTLAIGGSLGLQWLSRNGQKEAQARLIQRMKQNLEITRNAAHWSTSEVVQALELEFVDGLQRTSMRRALADLIDEYWGRFLPQEVLIDRLRKEGVSVPHVFA